ncbi:MAG: hypothetical protein ACRD1H_11620 [Vicinamibacterales bacterium]
MSRVIACAAGILLLITGCMDDDADADDRARAIAEAQRVYAERKAEGVDFTDGPCIAEEVIDDWAVDVAHDPRQEVDDRPENQCRSYRDDETHHFVELDPDGNLIRAR